MLLLCPFAKNKSSWKKMESMKGACFACPFLIGFLILDVKEGIGYGLKTWTEEIIGFRRGFSLADERNGEFKAVSFAYTTAVV